MHDNDRYLVIEGIDGIGKGVALEGVKEAAVECGLRVFDLHDEWKRGVHPGLDTITSDDYDVLVTAEPRYVGVGADVRWHLHNALPDARRMAHLFGEDRYEHLVSAVHPALDAGKIVVQSRTFLSTLVYQVRQAQMEGSDLSIDKILSHPGSLLARSRPPTHVLIGMVPDVGVLEERFAASHRERPDAYENLTFQASISPRYADPELLAAFGSDVSYFDAAVSVDHTKRSASESFRALFD